MIEINWKNDYKDKFICYKCEEGKLKLLSINKFKKVLFQCTKCKHFCFSSYRLSHRARHIESPLKSNVPLGKKTIEEILFAQGAMPKELHLEV